MKSQLQKTETSGKNNKGFTLILTLSLMVLITVIGVGYLSLARISLATSGRLADMERARSNARLALQLAIGQLQQLTGPDRRITAPADITSSSNGSRFWTGVYDSWASNVDQRPSSPNFLGYCISGDSRDIQNQGFASSAAGGEDKVTLVGEGTVGDDESAKVIVPPTYITQANDKKARIAWWSGEQNTKAAINTVPPANIAPTSNGKIRDTYYSPTNAVQLAANNAFKEFDPTKTTTNAKIISWNQTGIEYDKKETKKLFHDFSASSTGLLTNVRAGGFKKDLSLELQRYAPTGTAISNFSTGVSTPLYSITSAGNAVSGRSGTSENWGINFAELATYYFCNRQLGTTASLGSGTSGKYGHFTVPNASDAILTDDFLYYKLPAVVSLQMIYSLMVAPFKQGDTTVNCLQLVCNPVVTLWNPYDVPISIPNSTQLSIKYWKVPYTIELAGGKKCPIALADPDTKVDVDQNYFSAIIGGPGGSIVMRSAQVLKFTRKGGVSNSSNVASKHQLQLSPGLDFGTGYAIPLRDESRALIIADKNTGVGYTKIVPNGYTAGMTNTSGFSPNRHTRHFSMTHHELYIGYDRDTAGPSYGVGQFSIDFDFGNQRKVLNSESRSVATPGTKTSRLYANNFPKIFPEISGRSFSAGALGTPQPIMLFSFNAKTENSSNLNNRSFTRFNPKSLYVDFADLSDIERNTLPYEIQVVGLNGWAANTYFDTSSGNEGYFGGGLSASSGVNFVQTHSIPREPIASLAQFQHAHANGFLFSKPEQKQSNSYYATLNTREPMLPNISHAIGNSLACSLLSPNQVSGTSSTGRIIADHSYLANRELWDTWFMSGLAQRDNASYAANERDSILNNFNAFINSTTTAISKGKLPCSRYVVNLGSESPETVINKKLIRGSASNPSFSTNPDVIATVASYIKVDGMFNVNSTSVEAWKALLGGLRGKKIITRTDAASDAARNVEADKTPIVAHYGSFNAVADSGPSITTNSRNQWTSHRELSDSEITDLAKNIVAQIKLRGPFISLADFVNRRVSNDKSIAKSGAIESALENTTINAGYANGRSAAGNSVFKFPDAEQGPKSYGIPGIVKQADILTPIAPIINVRSDSFIIRAYGEAVDGNGAVVARAYCEATVERTKDYVDKGNAAELTINPTTLRPTTGTMKPDNQYFGRKYITTSFRWLSESEV